MAPKTLHPVILPACTEPLVVVTIFLGPVMHPSTLMSPFAHTFCDIIVPVAVIPSAHNAEILPLVIMALVAFTSVISADAAIIFSVTLAVAILAVAASIVLAETLPLIVPVILSASILAALILLQTVILFAFMSVIVADEP